MVSRTRTPTYFQHQTTGFGRLALVTVSLQTCDEPELVRQQYLGEPAKLIDAQLDYLAVVVHEPDAFPIVLGVTADHDLRCDMVLNAAGHVMFLLPPVSPGGHVPNLVRAAMVQQQNAATTTTRSVLQRTAITA